MTWMQCHCERSACAECFDKLSNHLSKRLPWACRREAIPMPFKMRLPHACGARNYGIAASLRSLQWQESKSDSKDMTFETPSLQEITRTTQCYISNVNFKTT